MLSKGVVCIALKPGDMVCREGAPAHAAFVVVSGQVDVFSISPFHRVKHMRDGADSIPGLPIPAELGGPHKAGMPLCWEDTHGSNPRMADITAALPMRPLPLSSAASGKRRSRPASPSADAPAGGLGRDLVAAQSVVAATKRAAAASRGGQPADLFPSGAPELSLVSLSGGMDEVASNAARKWSTFVSAHPGVICSITLSIAKSLNASAFPLQPPVPSLEEHMAHPSARAAAAVSAAAVSAARAAAVASGKRVQRKRTRRRPMPVKSNFAAHRRSSSWVVARPEPDSASTPEHSPLRLDGIDGFADTDSSDGGSPTTAPEFLAVPGARQLGPSSVRTTRRAALTLPQRTPPWTRRRPCPLSVSAKCTWRCAACAE